MHIGDIGGFGHIQCGTDESYVGSLIQDFSRNMSTSKYTVCRSCKTRGPIKYNYLQHSSQLWIGKTQSVSRPTFKRKSAV